MRLTLLYGCLFFLAGLALLGVTYALFQQQKLVPEGPGNRRLIVTTGPDGRVLTGKEAEAWFEEQQAAMRAATSQMLLTQGGIALVGVGGVAAGLGWFVAGRVLAPLHQVTETARRISAAPNADRGLHERIALEGPADEVKELADAFDVMVGRLDHSFDGQRRFVANASHELRTPLTLNRALVELAMHRKGAPPEVMRLGENLLEINARHERLISGLMLLAHADREVVTATPVDLADVVSHVIEQNAFAAKEAGVTVESSLEPSMIQGDGLLLERLVHNLIENAIKHNHEAGWVRITARDRVLEVANSGPVVPAYELPALFEPFRRLGSDRVVTGDGAGLGLSIALSIARAHGGDLSARARAGGGLEVSARFGARAAAHG